MPFSSDDPFTEGDPLLAGLNPAQADAVTHGDGPLLIIAGAGSGKTRVLTHRIAHLIERRGVSPFEILAITFTNKAADEMKSRVAALVGPVAQKMWVSTFHSACVRILRREAAALGYPSQFSIYDQADAVRLVTYVLRDLSIDPKQLPPRSVHATISAAKNRGQGCEEFAEAAQVVIEKRIADVYREYQARLLQRRRDGLRRPPRERRRALPSPARRPRAVSTEVPSCAGGRVPGHEPCAERARGPARRGAPKCLRRGRW